MSLIKPKVKQMGITVTIKNEQIKRYFDLLANPYMVFVTIEDKPKLIIARKGKFSLDKIDDNSSRVSASFDRTDPFFKEQVNGIFYILFGENEIKYNGIDYRRLNETRITETGDDADSDMFWWETIDEYIKQAPFDKKLSFIREQVNDILKYEEVRVDEYGCIPSTLEQVCDMWKHRFRDKSNLELARLYHELVIKPITDLLDACGMTNTATLLMYGLKYDTISKFQESWGDLPYMNMVKTLKDIGALPDIFN